MHCVSCLHASIIKLPVGCISCTAHLFYMHRLSRLLGLSIHRSLESSRTWSVYNFIGLFKIKLKKTPGEFVSAFGSKVKHITFIIVRNSGNSTLFQ